jgi:fructose-1-phosphate kinase PfkB-like protein
LREKPDFVKPNKRELMEHFSEPGEPSLRRLRQLCAKLVEGGAAKVALSMGKDGALFARGDEAFYCPGLEVAACSPVGAGDSMVGAFALAEESGAPWRQAAALAMAASAASVAAGGSKPPEKALVDRLIKKVRMEDMGKEL